MVNRESLIILIHQEKGENKMQCWFLIDEGNKEKFTFWPHFFVHMVKKKLHANFVLNYYAFTRILAPINDTTVICFNTISTNRNTQKNKASTEFQTN